MKKILSESINDDIYTMEQWEKDKVLNIKNGQKVSNDVVRELMNCVPPAFRERGIFQPGEAYCTEKDTYYDLYMTFTKDGDDYWTYCGTCRLGETQPREMMDYGSINEANKIKALIREAVKNALKEDYHNCSDEFYDAMVNLAKSAEKIMDYLSFTQEDGYEPNDERGYEDSFYLYKWAEDVFIRAQAWINTL